MQAGGAGDGVEGGAEPVTTVVDRGQGRVVEDVLEAGDAGAMVSTLLLKVPAWNSAPGRVGSNGAIRSRAAAEGAEGHAAADVLAERGQVRA